MSLTKRMRRVRRLLALHERDAGFKAVILRHNQVGMRLTGILGIGLVVAFLTGSVVEGKEIVSFPLNDYTSSQVAVIDKLVIGLLGVFVLLASSHYHQWGRLIVGVSLLIVVIAMVLDDAARGDISFAPMYVMIGLIVAVGAMPFRPLQTLALAAASIVCYYATISTVAPFAGLSRVGAIEGHLLILVLVGSVLSGVSLFLYNLRFQQYRVQRNTALLKERVERQALSLTTKNQFIRKVFGRYLTDEVVERLLESPSGLHLGGQKATVTILMSDIRGFSALSERLDAEEVVALLNTYLESMTRVIEAFGGTIDEFIGDAIMVIFGAPEQLADDAFRAVACAVAMQAAVEDVNLANADSGLPPIEVGISVHTGVAVVGNIGSEARAKYGVVGSVVNVAGRIESYSVGGQILISDSTLRAVRAPVDICNAQLVEPKGVSEPIKIFELTGVGPPYNLRVPKASVQLVPVEPGLPVVFSVLEEKFVERTMYKGRFVAISATHADIVSEVPLAALSNLKLRLTASGQPVDGDAFAKVTNAGEAHSTSRIRFTSLSPVWRETLASVVAPN